MPRSSIATSKAPCWRRYRHTTRGASSAASIMATSTLLSGMQVCRCRRCSRLARAFRAEARCARAVAARVEADYWMQNFRSWKLSFIDRDNTDHQAPTDLLSALRRVGKRLPIVHDVEGYFTPNAEPMTGYRLFGMLETR